MNVVIISKEKYEEMVGKLNRLSDRVNEILRKREGKRLSRWMDNQEVCQQLRISPRTLQTLRDIRGEKRSVSICGRSENE